MGSGPSGISSVLSNHSVEVTVERLQDSIRSKGMKLFALIDHSGEAEAAGLQMRPTKLLIFGNPAVGTPVMVAAPSSAIDLPLKVLVWEDGQNRVWLSFNDPAYVRQRHSIPQELLGNLAAAGKLVNNAAQ